jgi:hypothetical protein
MGHGHYRRIVLLIGLATIVQVVVILRNPVPAQDAVNFIQFARQLDHHSLVETLRSNVRHPLYPVLVWGYHSVLGSVEPEGASWVRSAQAVAGLASILLVVPMYLTGVRLGNVHLATAATAVFSVLPFVARMGADALSDSTYLLFMLLGVWACAAFLDTPLSRQRPFDMDQCGKLRWGVRHAGYLMLAGIANGIAFLARPESLLLPAALVATLILMQCRPEWRLPWRRVVLASICLIAGLMCVAAPYTLAIGKLTPKGSLNFLPGGRSLFARFDSSQGRPAARTLSDGRPAVPPGGTAELPAPPDFKLDFGLNHRSDEKRTVGFAGACGELGRELIEGLQYVLGPLVLVGIVFAERRPVNLFCSVLALAFLAVIVQFASKSGYVASRHVLTLICLACYVAARGGWVVAGWFPSLIRIHTPRSVEGTQRRVATGLLALAVAFCLPRSLGPLHWSRAAHVAAGHWLAEHAAAGSIVLDSRGWVSLFADLPSYDYNGARLAFQDPRLAYVVVESAEVTDDRPRGRSLRHLLEIAGRMVAEFESPAASGESVQIYAWHPTWLVSSEPAQQSIRAN